MKVSRRKEKRMEEGGRIKKGRKGRIKTGYDRKGKEGIIRKK